MVLTESGGDVWADFCQETFSYEDDILATNMMFDNYLVEIDV
jgi:hypothetical protein